MQPTALHCTRRERAAIIGVEQCAGALRNGWPLGKCNNNSKLKASEPRTKVKKEKITATITKSVKDISQNAYLKPFPKGLINEKKKRC